MYRSDADRRDKGTAEEIGVDLLVVAGVAMAESLDLPTRWIRSRLTVPRLADLCVIDLRDDDGSIREMAVASADAESRPLEACASDISSIQSASILWPA